MSHDLKAPLITIGGFIGFLEEDARSGNMKKFENDLERIRDAMRQPILFDGRNIYDPEKLAELGFHYRGVGRGYNSSREGGETESATVKVIA